MENKYLNTFTPFTRTSSLSWQSQLRHSVRLYLAMGSQPVDAQELESHLRRTEEELIQYLLEGNPPTVTALAQAQTILDMAQSALLSSEGEVKQLLQELANYQQTNLLSSAAPDQPPLPTDGAAYPS